MFDVQEFVEITTRQNQHVWAGTIRYRDKTHLIVSYQANEAAAIQTGASVQLAQVKQDKL